MEMGKKGQKEAVVPCFHGRRHEGKFQNVPRKRRENEEARPTYASCTQLSQENNKSGKLLVSYFFRPKQFRAGILLYSLFSTMKANASMPLGDVKNRGST